MKKRKYQQKARAEQTQETRQVIVEAAVKLHEELGPAQTSIKAIAEEAGVQRLTVYRHFPDETSLFQACTSHWFGSHPPPVVADVVDPEEKVFKTLLSFYHYYRNNERMLYVAYRDLEEVEALQGPMSEVEAYIDSVKDDLLATWDTKGKLKKNISITLRHCLRFSTWCSLNSENLTDKQMVDLVIAWIRK